MKRSVALVVVVAALLSCLLGCGPKTTPPESPGVTPPTPSPTTSTTPSSTAFAWTDQPMVAQIPDSPIQGMVNGKPFVAKTVRVKSGEGEATLQISNMAADTPTGMLMGDTCVELDFSQPAGKPGELVMTIADKKDFEKQHAFYYYPQGGDKGPMSINTDWGCALSITEWKLQKDPSDEAILGRVKGRVAVVFQDESKSWVAGSFDGVYYK